MTTLLNKDVKQSELLDRLVLDFNTTEIVGRVKKLWLDVKSHQVRGLTCTRGIFERERHMFPWDKVITIGHDSILVNIEDQGEVEQPESIDNVIGLKVWTDAGNKVGKLVDYCIDTNTGAVAAYLFSSNGWRGIANGTYVLAADAVITVGSKRIIVAEASVANARQYEEGLNKKIQHAQKFIQEDIAKSQSDFGVAMQNTQRVASQFQTKAHQATEVTRDRLSTAAKQLQQHKPQKVSSQERDKLAESEANTLEEISSPEESDRQLLQSNADSELDTEETSI